METKIFELLNKPVCVMTGYELYELIKYAQQLPDITIPGLPERIAGIHSLAVYLGCCDSTVFKMKRKGILDHAIVSRVGKRIIFDGRRARTLVDEYLKSQTNTKICEKPNEPGK